MPGCSLPSPEKGNNYCKSQPLQTMTVKELRTPRLFDIISGMSACARCVRGGGGGLKVSCVYYGTLFLQRPSGQQG